MFDRMHRAGII